jgi:hypothetical protein
MSYSGTGWDWVGIFTHFSLELFGSLFMAALLLYGRYHIKHKTTLIHKVAHSYKLQFGLDTIIDFVVAIITIQLLHL